MEHTAIALVVSLNVTFRIDRPREAGQIYLQWSPTCLPALVHVIASYSYKVVDYHTDTLNFHTYRLALHSFIACYSKVGFSRHKYRVAEPAGNYYRPQKDWCHAPLPAQTSSHSLSMAGTKDSKR